MPTRIREESDVVLRFGGGIHSRASEADINEAECALGENFELDLQNREYRNRKPFDLLFTVPNESEIRGFVTLLETDGTVHWAVQAGDKVYDWDGITTLTEIATVDSSARLRGRLEHNWKLDNKVLITDLQLADVVMEWNGDLSAGSFVDVSFTDEEDNPFGTFKAKYCYISQERAVFANVDDGSTATPHLIVGAKRGDYTNITVANRPSSAIALNDPFFLVQPDYFAINGMIEAFNEVVTSSEQGSLFRLTGSDANDFNFVELFPRSGAKGDESLAYVGNDIMYGRSGRLESVRATEEFGDVEINDLTVDIADQLQNFDDWTTVYNSRTQRVYFFPASGSEIWVLNKTLLGQEISPWSKWTTVHPIAFNPTAVMNMLDPQDGLEYVFFGDEDGNVYRLEGTGSDGDGGTDAIRTFRTSKLYEGPLDAHVYNLDGWVRYRKDEAASLTLTFEYAGENLFNEEFTIDLDAVEDISTYNSSLYYNDGNYYGATFRGRLARDTFVVPSHSTEFQIRTSLEGTGDFAISEIGVRLTAAS